MNEHAAWAHPSLIDRVLRVRCDGNSDVTVRVASLGDARQRLRLEQILRSLPETTLVSIDAAAARVRVVWDAARLPLPALLQVFDRAGCAAQPLSRDDVDSARGSELHDMLKRLLVAGMFAMQVMSYALVIYLGVVDFVDFTTRSFFRWLCLLTSIPVLFYGARPFFGAALRGLRARRAGIDLPVAIALLVVSAASTINTIRSHGEIYFDSISMLVFLLLLARYVEMRARNRNGALGDSVIDAAPMIAHRRDPAGGWEIVPALVLKPGDLVHVDDADTVPADGILLSDAVQVDEALLTGESRPCRRVRGERLLAGSVILGGPAELRVEHAGDVTLVARMGHLAQRARMSRGQCAGDHVMISRFVASVLVLTTLTAAGWLLIDPARALDAAVSVLVVTCPCALALTRPASVSRAFAVLARSGVLVTRTEALTTLARADTVVFDKTGTLTMPSIAADSLTLRGNVDARHAWMLAGALAGESSHPLARALNETARTYGVPPQAHAVNVVGGAGIRGEVDGQSLRLGRPGFALPGLAVDGQADSLWLADDQGNAIASFRVTETPRPCAHVVLDTLRREGVSPVLASGDDTDRVADVAAWLGIDQFHALQRPEDKLALLTSLRAGGHVTLAVGDGSNDAPALAGADVSAALASGTGLAQSQADLLLLDGDLRGLLQARIVSAQVNRAITQNRRWSLAYNFCTIPLAVCGLVPPWLAAIGMSISSLIVVLNALRVIRTPAAPAAVPA